jgi:hypothetical protein
LGNLWRFLFGKKDAAVDAAPPPAPPEAPGPPLEEPFPTSGPSPLDDEPRDLASLELPPALQAGFVKALETGSSALLFDPEEFACMLCRFSESAVEQIGECSLDDYDNAFRSLQLLDHQRLVHGDRTVRVQLFNSVTDLGRRMIFQFFDPAWDAGEITERRKAIVRLLNRLRPGTSLTRHNRDTLLATLRRAGERPGPCFRDRLMEEGLVDDEAPTDLETLVRTAVLPRKAVARVLGEYLDIPFVDVEDQLPRQHARLLEKQQVIDWEAMPCGEEGEKVLVAMVDPTDPAAVERLSTQLGRPVEVRVAAGTDIRVAADKIFRFS